MRVSHLFFLAIPALAAAQDQIPLFDKAQAWFDRASSFVKSAARNPGRVAAEKVAQATVTPLTYSNWKSTLQHSGHVKPGNPPEAWMIYVTGGNRTCGGRCGHTNNMWNEAVAYLAADVTAPKLAVIDCETQELLCGAWATPVQSVWVVLVPQPAADQSTASTHITIHPLNGTATAVSDITNIHTQKLYLQTPNYEGALHPFDGWVGKYNLTDPMAYALFYISRVPSWAFMIFLSLFSRWFVSKRMPPAAPQGNVPAAG